MSWTKITNIEEWKKFRGYTPEGWNNCKALGIPRPKPPKFPCLMMRFPNDPDAGPGAPKWAYKTLTRDRLNFLLKLLD